jgi:DNA-binding XRE family transcriptional regulator
LETIDLTGARHTLGVSQKTLARFVGVSERQMIRYENGHSPIPGPLSLLLRILIDGSIPEIR